MTNFLKMLQEIEKIMPNFYVLGQEDWGRDQINNDRINNSIGSIKNR